MDLSKGDKINLSKAGEKMTKIRFGVNWGMKERRRMFGLVNTKTAVDLDISAILLNASGSRIGLVYFGNLYTYGIHHSGDDRSGDSNPDSDDNETITVDFPNVNGSVASVLFVLNSYSGESFGDVPYASVRIYEGEVNKPTKTLATYKLDTKPEFAAAKSIIVGRAYRREDGWNFEAIGTQTRHQRLAALMDEIEQFI